MLKKFNPFAILTLSALTMAVIYFFWTSQTNHPHNHDEHDHDHEHEEIVILTPEQIQSAGIEIQVAAPGKLQKIVESPGKIIVNADVIAHIHPKVSGIVKEARKNLGEHVEAGEIIAILESREIAEAKTAYLTALKKEKLNRTVMQQEQILQTKGISSLQDYQNSLNAAESSNLDLELTKQHLQALGLSELEIEKLPGADTSALRIFEIRAPFEGNILSRHITPGELLRYEDEVYVIGDLSKLWVEVSFYPHDLPYIKKGQNVLIADANGRKAKAEILYISPVIDDDTRRAKAIALLENPKGEWHAGTYVTVNSVAEKIAVPMMITKEAIQKVDGEDCAFILTEKGFEITPVRTGRSDGKFYEITSGIEEGSQYASKNTFLLKAEHEKDEAEHMH